MSTLKYALNDPEGKKIVVDTRARVLAFIKKSQELGVKFNETFKSIEKNIETNTLHYIMMCIKGVDDIKAPKNVSIELKCYTNVYIDDFMKMEIVVYDEDRKNKFEIRYHIVGFADKFSAILKKKYKRLDPELQDGEYGSADATFIEPTTDQILIESPKDLYKFVKEILEMNQFIEERILTEIRKVVDS